MFTKRWSRTGNPLRHGRRGRTRLTIEALEDRILLTGDMVLRWNEAMIAAVRTAGQSPPVAARSAAIVQAAVFEAVNSIDGSYSHYLVDIPAPAWASKEAAAAEASHDALVGLFPSQAPVLDLELLASLQGMQAGDAKTWGISVGHAAAQIMLAVRAHDGSDRVVTYTPGTDPGDWQPTPPAFGPPLVPQWPGVTPLCPAKRLAVSPAATAGAGHSGVPGGARPGDGPWRDKQYHADGRPDGGGLVLARRRDPQQQTVLVERDRPTGGRRSGEYAR